MALRRVKPLRIVLLAVLAWPLQRLSFLTTRPRVALSAAVEAKLGRQPNGTKLKESIDAILESYQEDFDSGHLRSSFQELAAGSTLSPGLYNKALKAMALAGRPADCEDFLTFMKTQVEPDGAAYDHLVMSHLNAGNSEEALRLLLSSPKVLLKTCKRVLRSLLEKNDYASASRLMSCVPSMGLQPSYPMYKGMAAKAAEEGNFEMAEQWLQQLKADGLQADSGLFAALIKACHKDSARALRYFNLMQAAGLDAPKGVYGFVIRIYAQENQVDSAVYWLERMIEAGLEPNLETYEALLQAAAPELRTELESSWIERLQSKGGLEREVYKTILRVESRSGNLLAASEWFRKMGEKGFERLINEHNELLKACEVTGGHHSALKTFTRLEKKVKPNVESYSLMIKTIAKAGQPKLASKWRKKMEDAGLLTASSLPFELIAKRLASSSQNAADYVAEWVQLALNFQKPVATSSYQTVIKAYLEENSPLEAQKWLDLMRLKGVKPDYATYLMLMRLDDRKAASWHEEMEANGVQPTTESFNLVIRSFSHVKGEKRMKNAETWYQRMLDAGITPDEGTYSQLISAAAKSGQLEEADRYFSLMSENGLGPDRAVYQALMVRSLMGRDPIAVRQVLDWMVLKGITIHRGAYNLAIRAFAEAGDLTEAEEVYERLLTAGRYPDERTFTFLIEAHAKQGNMKEAREWFSEMIKRKVRPGFRIYSALVKAAAEQSDVQSTMEFLSELELRKFHGTSQSAWSDTLRPALQCLRQAGEDKKVAQWMEFGKGRGLDLSFQAEEVLPEAVTKESPSRTRKGKRGDVKVAMQALESLRAEGKTPTIKDFNAVMKEFASSPGSRYSMAKVFLESDVMKSVEPDESTFLHLLRCNRQGDGRRGMETIEWMREKGFKVTRKHLEVVVRQVFQDAQGDVHSLEKLLDSLDSQKLRNDLYNAVILQAEDLPEVARDWAKRAREEGFWIPVKTCYHMAKASLKEDDIASLWWLEQAAKSEGSSPLSRMGPFLETLGRAGEVDRGGKLLERLIATDSIQKDEVPYLQMIESYARVGQPEGAADWLDKMAATGDVPVEAYNAVIRGYAEAGDSQTANMWLARLRGSDLKPNAESYLAVLEPLASLGELQPVEEIFKELSGRGLATREAELAVFRAYCVAGSDQVQAWRSRLDWEGVALDAESYQALLRFYLDKGELSEALALIEEMSLTDSVPPGLWEQLLKAAREREDVAHAQEVASAMSRHGVQLTSKHRGHLRELLGEDFEALTQELRKA